MAELALAEVSQFVGTVLQDSERQIIGSNVLAEIAFGLENLGLPADEIMERVQAVASRLHLDGLLERETWSLSGGEKQKVALAGGLALNTTILLLDEPLASLDPASSHEALTLFRRLADDGTAILLVEHRVEDALAVRPDRMLYLEEGRVEYLGPVRDLPVEVDYRQVKLPAEWVIRRARERPGQVARRPAPKAAGSSEPIIVFDHVEFAYDDGPLVLRDVNLSIHAGDLVALLGPNGAGKSTLVKHAIGLLKPTRGEVYVRGKSTRKTSVAEMARQVGYVFQSPSHMLFAPSVNEELAFGPKNLGHPAGRIEKEVRQALEIVHLEDRGVDSPLALSFGQQKRVSIAAILAMQSRLLVMDEPTAGQDYQNYMDFMDAILEMPAFEAVVFITHDVDLAVSYANRVLLMADGRVRADGPPHEVLRDLTLLEACRLVPTSLLQENLKRVERTGRFLRAEALAHA